MRNQHLYKSPYVYGHRRLLALLIFFGNLGLKNLWCDWGVEPTTLDLSSLSGAYDHDHSAMATPKTMNNR